MDNPDVMMYGAINSLRTGNIVVDMAVVFMVPYMFRTLLNFFQQFFPMVWAKIDKLLLRGYRRQIVHVQDTRGWVEDKSGYKNNILIYAIKQYVGNELKTQYPMGSYKLSAIKSRKSEEMGSTVNQLEKHYKIIKLPVQHEAIEVVPGVWFTESERMEGAGQDEDDRGKPSTTNTITMITLTASRIGGKKKVDDFVEKAYKWYCNRVASLEDTSRFMYQPLVKDKYASSEEKQKPRIYKRYKLSGEKTFSSLFFPEKKRLLNIIDMFTEKKGKYKIKGFPHKLGLLLHGPPGTGKTSLVKAIAAMTNRHIISVPLSRIHTNQELMDVMFDQLFNFKAPGKGGDDEDEEGGTNNRLSFKDVIFLMEDVDAATKIVHARKKKHVSTNAKQIGMALERTYTDTGIGGADEEDKEKKLKDIIEQQAALLEAAKKSSGTTSDKKDTKDGKDSTDKKDDGSDDKAKDISSYEKDKLNLAGLLTVLDGIVDAPERVLVMTTNHPEKLDPALTRPGRVNMQIYMGFIRAPEAIEMAKHYFADQVSKADAKAMTDMFDDLNSRLAGSGGFKMSPAEMEQKCAESDSVADLLRVIREKGEKAIAAQ